MGTLAIGLELFAVVSTAVQNILLDPNGLIRGLLVGVSPSDPLTLAAAALGLHDGDVLRTSPARFGD